jgi:1-phosphofructokinase family hexose kinase
MILTVTLNSGIDQVLLVDELALGLAVQANKTVTCVGGKGLDVSVALSGLGVQTKALAFMAGETGTQLREIIERYGIEQEIIWVEGETRICYVIAESAHQRVSHIKAGRLNVRAEHMHALLVSFRRSLAGASWAIMAGSLPDGVENNIYSELVGIAREVGVKSLVDCSGAAALASVQARPDILKMNRQEFNHTFQKNCQDMDEALHCASEIRIKHSLACLIVTCGSEGLTATTPQGSFHIRAPVQAAINAAGAGDAASAALTWRLSLGDGWETALQWAGAVSAAAVLTEATGEVDLREAEHIYPSVRVDRMDAR